MRAFIALAGAAALLAAAALALPARAGVVNPDISVIGQPFLRWSDALGDPARKRPVLDPGETEVVLDAPLNPYARGNVTLSFADGAVDVEEAYFLVSRGLPAGLALKAGKYRVGFGKLNPQHHGQEHIISRRPGSSASTPEISPAVLRMNVNGIQDAAGSLRPYNYQEEQCA